MARTALDLTPEELRTYRLSAHPSTPERAERLEQAWELARQAAQLLRDTFGATRVVAFGSLTSPESFTRWSDVDLAAWGIPSRQYFRAVAAVTGLSSDFRVDLIDADDCTARLLDHVTSEGTGLLRTPTA